MENWIIWALCEVGIGAGIGAVFFTAGYGGVTLIALAEHAPTETGRVIAYLLVVAINWAIFFLGGVVPFVLAGVQQFCMLMAFYEQEREMQAIRERQKQP